MLPTAVKLKNFVNVNMESKYQNEPIYLILDTCSRSYSVQFMSTLYLKNNNDKSFQDSHSI